MLQKAWKEQLSCNLWKLTIRSGLEEDRQHLVVGGTIVYSTWMSSFSVEKNFLFGFMPLISFDIVLHL